MGRNSATFVLVLLVSGQPTPAVAQLQLHVEEKKGTEFQNAMLARLSPDGKVWVQRYGSMEDELRVFDAITGKLLASKAKPVHKGGDGEAVFSPDGTQFAYIARGGAKYSASDFVSLWETTTWKQSAVLRLDGASRLAFSPDGRTLAVLSVGDPYTISLWELNGAKGARERAVLNIGSVTAVTEPPSRLSYSPDGKLLFTGRHFVNTETEEYHLFRNEDAKPPRRLPEGVFSLSHVAISPDSKLFFALAFGAGKGLGYSFRDMKTGKVVCDAEVRGDYRTDPRAPMFSPDGKLLVLASGERFELIDVGTGKSLASIEGSPVKFAKDSKSLIGVGKTGPVTWELTWKQQPPK